MTMFETSLNSTPRQFAQFSSPQSGPLPPNKRMLLANRRKTKRGRGVVVGVTERLCPIPAP